MTLLYREAASLRRRSWKASRGARRASSTTRGYDRIPRRSAHGSFVPDRVAVAATVATMVHPHHAAPLGAGIFPREPLPAPASTE